MKSPATFFVVQLLSNCPRPSNEHDNKAELRVPRRRINRELITAPKETNAAAVEPINARVESGARFSEDSLL